MANPVPSRWRRAPLVFFLAAVATGVASAHDFWIEPSSFTPAPGGLVSARLRVGMNFKGDFVPRDDKHLVKFTLYGPTQEAPFQGSDGADPAGLTRVMETGIHIIGYQTTTSD